MTEAEPNLELEKLRLEHETRKYEARQKVKQVIYGTMLVGLAAAAFPFFQKLAELATQNQIEERRQATEIAIEDRRRTTEIAIATNKYQLQSELQQAKFKEERRAFLQSLAEEARSADIDRRIRLAEFFAHLAAPDELENWEKFRKFLDVKQKRVLDERAKASAVAGDPSESIERRSRAQAQVQSIDLYLNPKEIEISALPLEPFLMAIEDVFSIRGRGLVVTGRVDRGAVAVGDELEIVGLRDTQRTIVTGLEKFREIVDTAVAGDNVGLLLSGVSRADLERGQVLAAPGTITPHLKFEASIRMLPVEEGGRRTPVFDNYRPQFYFRTTDVAGSIALSDAVESILPGQSSNATVTLEARVALENQLQFAIREGGRTVGEGVITRIIE